MRPVALVAITVLTLTAGGALAVAAGPGPVWVRAEVVENTVEGPANARCELAARLGGREGGHWRVFYGEVRADAGGGWTAIRPRSGCAEVASEQDPGPWALRGSPYLLVDIDLTSATPGGHEVQIDGSLTIRKLNGFAANGAPTYQRSSEKLGLQIADGSSTVVPVLIADSRERDELRVRELLVRVRAEEVAAKPRAGYGEIAVSADEPRAHVLLDGQLAGIVPGDGTVLLPNVSAGERVVAVRDASGREARANVRVEKGQQSKIALALLPTAKPGDPAGLRGLGRNPQGSEELWREKDGAIVVRLAGGEFQMGSPDGQGEASEHPQHGVRVAGFLIDKTEVTWGQFRRFATETSRALPKAPVWGMRESWPASNVTWEDARAYCAWAGGRLPTEAEWEYAARGRGARVYPWGDDWDASRCNTRDGGPHAPTAVATYPNCISADGVLDLSGSVWEWCADWYGADYYAKSPAENPRGPETGELRVSRGGSWINPSVWSRAAYRQGTDPSWPDTLRGFRCVQDDPAGAVATTTPSPTPAAAQASPALDGAPRVDVVVDTAAVGASGRAESCTVTQTSGADRLVSWSTFGAARPKQGGGFELGPAAACGNGPFTAGPLAGDAPAPYLIVEVSAAPSLDSAPMDPGPGRMLQVGLSVATRKLSGFSAEGAPLYADPTLDQRLARLQPSGEFDIPLPLSDPRERQALGREILIRLRAEQFPGGATTQYGTILVLGAAPMAEILLDGSSVSRAGADGSATLTNVPPGSREVGVKSATGAPTSRLVEALGGATVAVSFDVASAAPALLAAGENAQGFAQFRRARDGALMVAIPAGELTIGNLETEGSPLPHKVRLSAFLMDQLPVTWKRYEQFAAATGRRLPPEPYWGLHDDHPAVYVSWDEARAFCEWAGARLPTEAEREKGARGTDGRLFPWGDEPPSPDRAVFRRNWGYQGTDPVGIRPNGASPYGLLDVGGNVWEWCDDWYDPDYYKASPEQDPTGPRTGRAHIVRGGSWDSRPTVLSSSCRNWGYVGYREGDFGFRCAADPPM